MINILKQIVIIFKKAWKGIKSVISLKIVASSVPNVPSFDNGDTITDPCDIANTFNHYCVSIAETIKKVQNIHIKSFQTILQMKMVLQCLFNLPIKKKQLTSYPHSTLITLLAQIVYLIEHFLKKCKFRNHYQIYSRWYSNLQKQFLFLTKIQNQIIVIIVKILRKLIYKGLYTFLNNNNIIYNLQLGFR